MPQEEFAASTAGRILSWLLSTFRIIVILTELVVMGAFLSRFWLDAKSNDLNEIIYQKQAVIAATKDFEEEFRSIQKKLKAFADITVKKTSATNYLEVITSYLPPDITLTSLQLTQESIQLRGISASEVAISQLISNLEENPEFTNILLMGVNTSQQNKSLLVFNIKIEFTKEGGK